MPDPRPRAKWGAPPPLRSPPALSCCFPSGGSQPRARREVQRAAGSVPGFRVCGGFPPDVLSLSLRTGCAPAPAATPRLRPTAEESDPISATWANGVLPREGTGRLNSGTSLRQPRHARPLPKRHSAFQRPGSGSWWPRPDLKNYFSFHSLVLWTCFLPASMRGLRPPVWPLSRLPRVPGTPQTHDADGVLDAQGLQQATAPEQPPSHQCLGVRSPGRDSTSRPRSSKGVF